MDENDGVEINVVTDSEFGYYAVLSKGQAEAYVTQDAGWLNLSEWETARVGWPSFGAKETHFASNFADALQAAIAHAEYRNELKGVK